MTLKEFTRLSWELLEHRVRYYYFDAPVIGDSEYDKLERAYIYGCNSLKQPDTRSVGINLELPSVKLVVEKLNALHKTSRQTKASKKRKTNKPRRA